MLAHKKITPEEYLAIERKASFKSEYFDGQVFAMAGASAAHEKIKFNVGGEIYAQFKRRPCEAYTSDMRVKVPATGLYTYPDVVALCGDAIFEDKDTLLNPSVVFEVLSPTTEAYDRGGKFAHYRTVESLTDYILIAQDRMSVDHFVRQADGTWAFAAYTNLTDVLRLPGIGVHVPLSDIYDKVELPPPDQSSMTPKGA